MTMPMSMRRRRRGGGTTLRTLRKSAGGGSRGEGGAGDGALTTGTTTLRTGDGGEGGGGGPGEFLWHRPQRRGVCDIDNGMVERRRNTNHHLLPCPLCVRLFFRVPHLSSFRLVTFEWWGRGISDLLFG